MKPSEFWAQIFALPEQARQAEGEAAELRVRADALTAWAKQATSAHRDALFAADAEEMGRAVEILSRLPARPDVATNDSPAEEHATSPERTRKQRSNAGKPRVRVGTNPDGSPKFNGQIARRDTDDESAPANPADVRAEDAARVKLAGELRSIIASSTGPITVSWLYAQVDEASEEKIRGALSLLSLVSWRMRRDGDSQPVEVWGTYKQFATVVRAHVEAHGFGENGPIPIDSVATALGARTNDVRIALGASRA